MRSELIICDLCLRNCTEDEVFRVPVRSRSFVNYANFDDLFADRRKIDICKECVKDFREFVRTKRQEVNHG